MADKRDRKASMSSRLALGSIDTRMGLAQARGDFSMASSTQLTFSFFEEQAETEET